MKLTVTRLLAALTLLILAVPAGAVLVAWSGLYDVAASRGHWHITDSFLRFGMEQSVKARASDAPAPPLDDPNLVRLGAAHFHTGCAWCHGMPGTPIGPVPGHMLPPPPDLGERASEWTDQELFWIVKHGIKYAGMPAWPTQSRDDEVWTLVAFLRRLPALEPESYMALALGGMKREPKSGRELAMSESAAAAVGGCASCHGAEDRMPTSSLVPRLHGQPAPMLRAALDAFAAGERESGIMQPVAAMLSPAERQELADYYAGRTAPATAAPDDPQSVLVERGRALATDGDASALIPACNGCHGADAHPLYPRLAGQSAPYLGNQLRLWQNHPRRTRTSPIMTPIAERLSEHQINEVAAYYASLPPAISPVKKAGEP